jgi:crotonobetainyl-CoA:carnitine CoA-transferase CaiB-like acyl-CoA transferase
MAIAGGIAAGLVQRSITGEAPIIDVSLLGLAMWVLSPDIVASGLYSGDHTEVRPQGNSESPVGNYQTSDGRT